MSEIEAVAIEAIEEASLPGAALQQARKNLAWSVEEVAAKLHLTQSAVTSLEADRYEELPGVTFVRGYIRAYAKLVGLDQDLLAKQYTERTVSEPVRALPDLGRTVARSRGRGRFVMAVLLLIVLAILVVGYFWWQDEQNRNAGVRANEEIAFSQVEIERADGTLHIQSLDELDAYTADLEVAEISLDSLQPALADTAEPAIAEAGADSQPTDTAKDTAASSEQNTGVAVSGQHQLELTFTDECWIRITDSSGQELASGLHQPGEVLRLSGDSPFELHLGNAGGVQLNFNGQPVDFHSSIRGNVARIKLG